MPAVTSGGGSEEEGKEEKISEDMWRALKKHIIRERQRKKEEHEAEVEEERLRKEKEARERQDVMTLGETREQIKHMETKLSQLKEQKHQLFLQLKKVLNEDDNRKKQQNKDSNEMLANINGMMPGENIIQAQILVPQKVSQQGSPIISRPINAHIHNKNITGGMKRGRSPSPTYATLDAPYIHHHKQSHPQHSQGPAHKTEDRSRDMTRAVLWNKPSQYASGAGGASFYPVPSQAEQHAPPLLYAGPLYQHVQHHMPTKQVVMSLSDTQANEYSRRAPPPGGSSLSSQRHTPQLISGQVQVQVHPSQVGPQQLQHSAVQSSKPGSITTGYPVRQPLQNPPMQNSPMQNSPMQNSNLYPSRHRY